MDKVPRFGGTHVSVEQERDVGDFPGGPVVKTLLQEQGEWVQSLVRELSSCMLCSKKKSKKERDIEENACVLAHSLRRVRLFVTPWAVASQAPLSLGFFRQEYWNGLPFPPPPGDLPDSEIQPASPVSCIDRQITYH